MNVRETLTDECIVLSHFTPVGRGRSWLPPSAQGLEPFNCYLFRNDHFALLIDTGPVSHRAFVMEALDSLIGPRPLTVAVTRGELECIGNLGVIANRFPDTRFLSVTKNLPLLGLVHYDRTNQDIRPAVRIAPGDTFAEYGFPDLLVRDAPIRTLSTIWIEDRRNGILFTSDFFSCQLAREFDTSLILTNLQEINSVDAIREHILTKFDWIKHADMSLLDGAWRGIFQNYDLKALAPGIGRISSGTRVTQTMVERHQLALFATFMIEGAKSN